MKQILKYPGAKNRLASWICSFIPEHEVYLEPYFGSGAVFFNKPKCRIETVNDLNHDVFNYFKVLRDYPEELIRIIDSTPFSREEYMNAWVSEDNLDEIEKARRFAIRCWMAIGSGNRYRNGFRSGQQSSSPSPAHTWANLPDALKEATNRLKNTQIENLPAIELIKRYDTKDVFIYADPPYLHETREKNKYLYEHEMTKEEHEDLLKTLLVHPGKVLISGYDSELYNQFLSGWHKEYKNTLAECGIVRQEVLWMNYDIQMKLF